jgi:hypothetical protein
MGSWELNTESGWICVAPYAQAVTLMSPEARHSCYENPMCIGGGKTQLRWNPEREYEPVTDDYLTDEQ